MMHVEKGNFFYKIYPTSEQEFEVLIELGKHLKMELNDDKKDFHFKLWIK